MQNKWLIKEILKVSTPVFKDHTTDIKTILDMRQPVKWAAMKLDERKKHMAATMRNMISDNLIVLQDPKRLHIFKRGGLSSAWLDTVTEASVRRLTFIVEAMPAETAKDFTAFVVILYKMAKDQSTEHKQKLIELAPAAGSFMTENLNMGYDFAERLATLFGKGRDWSNKYVENAYDALRQDLPKAIKTYGSRSGTLSAEQRDVLLAIADFTGKNDAKLPDLVSKLKDSYITRLFGGATDTTVKRQLDKLEMSEAIAIKTIEKHAGKKWPLHPKDDIALIKSMKDDPADYKLAKRVLLLATKAKVANAIRTASADDTLEADGDISMSIGALKKKIGEPYARMLPIGIDKLHMNDRFELQTHEGVALASGQDKFVPTPGTAFTLNKAFKTSTRSNPAYVKYENAMGNMVGLYLLSLKNKSASGRAEKAQGLMKNMDQVIKNVAVDLEDDDQDTAKLASILMLMLLLAGRVGSVGNETDGEKTYGMSTLLADHVTIKGNEIVVSYDGKAGMSHTQIINPELVEEIPGGPRILSELKANLAAYKKRAKPGEYLFQIGSTKLPPNNSKINAYFKSKGANTTGHKIRHAVANTLFNRFYPADQMPFATQKKAEEAFIDTMNKVGEKLGHKKTSKTGEESTVWQTAAKSYVDKKLQRDFWTKAGWAPTKRVGNIIMSGV